MRRLRIVVHPASMHIGGSQRNAVDLAVQLLRRGHDVRVFGPPGPLVELLDAGGVPFHPSPPVRRMRPSPGGIRALSRVVREHRVEVVHAWEWPPIADAVYGPGLTGRVAVVGSVMSMGVAPFIPCRLPLTVGTAAIAAHERPRRPGVVLLEPPVDTEADAPVDSPTRARHRLALGVGRGEVLLVIVSRLVQELKREGILDAVRAAGILAAEGLPVRLVIAGDGPVRAEVDALAAGVNAVAGRDIVTCVGAVDDPSPHYAAADVVLGMGGSALRAAAFGQPVIVQGERGFWRTLTPATLPGFLHAGWYGLGDGGDGAAALADFARPLLTDPDLRAGLGAFGRELAVRRFSLAAAAATVERLYLDALGADGRGAAGNLELATSLAGLARYDLRRRVDRRLGRASADDFNAVAAQPPPVTPVAAPPAGPPPAGPPAADPPPADPPPADPPAAAHPAAAHPAGLPARAPAATPAAVPAPPPRKVLR